ncbi:hypothetical protein MA16_Dca002549 [Dendrobium catenatum]|uniref:Uncharacterized protein n=1 Tax=Dendrobium catenatum TaxID=906689 RepID=A0A2I0W0U6_9ASPA|nr:hypothetical protein MA16_Dca002549 [Dendrobium catenatum]
MTKTSIQFQQLEASVIENELFVLSVPFMMSNLLEAKGGQDRASLMLGDQMISPLGQHDEPNKLGYGIDDNGLVIVNSPGESSSMVHDVWQENDYGTLKDHSIDGARLCMWKPPKWWSHPLLNKGAPIKGNPWALRSFYHCATFYTKRPENCRPNQSKREARNQTLLPILRGDPTQAFDLQKINAPGAFDPQIRDVSAAGEPNPPASFVALCHIGLDHDNTVTLSQFFPNTKRITPQRPHAHVHLELYPLMESSALQHCHHTILVIVPVNVSGGTLLDLKKEIVFSNIDKLSISNVRPGSVREYDNVAFMRLHFLASQHRRVEQFTVVVRNVPRSGNSISETVVHFFQKNHPDHYLGHQVGFLGLCGERLDSIGYYKQRISEVEKRMECERQRILRDSKAVLPVAFVTFDSRWGAAVCAQTQQSRNPTHWLTDWAPEPRDIYWKNLAIPFVSLSIRRFLMSISLFALVFFYMIPITFVQSLANLEGLEKVAPFLTPVIEL